MAKLRSQIAGRWRITAMTAWDNEFIDEEVLFALLRSPAAVLCRAKRKFHEDGDHV